MLIFQAADLQVTSIVGFAKNHEFKPGHMETKEYKVKSFPITKELFRIKIVSHI